ncbi:MAG: SDR family oxidoreductase [Pyrinomonadaceae bacterium]|nr:SDR family oxidoreductase [Pyrinomonadaceae bacterium]
MNVFITGATGFVGSVIAEKLKGKGHKIAGLARNDDSEKALNAKGISPVRGDLGDPDVLKRSAREADAVIHTAFSHGFDDYDDAVRLDRTVIESFAEVLKQTNKPLIVTSSSAVLGETGRAEADEDHAFDRNSTRLLRGEVERDVLRLPQIGIRAVVLRLPLFVYGRGGSSFLPFLINQAKAENSANYIETGSQRVSAVHVEDAADLYLLALETSTAKGLFNVSAETVSMKDLAEAIARMLNIEGKSISEEKARKQFGKMFEFLSVNNQMTSEKAVRELRWVPNSYHSIIDDVENGSYRRSMK